MKGGNSTDLILLGKFQKASDWMQDYFGYNNFNIARFLRIVMIISFFIREVLSFLNGIKATEIIVITCSVMIVIKIELILNRAQQSVRKNPSFINPVVSEYAITRLIMQFIGMAAFGLLIKNLYYIINSPVSLAGQQYDLWKEFFWDLFGTLMFFVAYFGSCTPKPYKPGKVKKFIEQITDGISQRVAAPLPRLARL
jgi:hypothetical protein